MKAHLTLAAVLGLLAAPVFADHGNPWATEDDVVLSQYHDINQAKSIGTPGENEMRGLASDNARGNSKNAGRTNANRGSEPKKRGGNAARH
ncbi:hypothetical protein [Celeribacter marinus]|uniref:hypothetical protein n=1 Tax=Celeribacter marinus TaxID=1397108 RepID=UPI0007805BF1|nr:hypothetical protein [Celeribacter marinus]SFL06731.1 hypothetical protein SAMN05444421_11523 [Celeribacter marinus]